MLLDPKPIEPTDISATQIQPPDDLSADLDLTGLLPDLRAQIAEAMKTLLTSASKVASQAASQVADKAVSGIKSVADDRSLAALAPAEKSALTPYLWPGADNALSAAATAEDATNLPLVLPSANMLNPDGLPGMLNPSSISSYLQKIATTPSCSLPASCSARTLP